MPYYALSREAECYITVKTELHLLHSYTIVKVTFHITTLHHTPQDNDGIQRHRRYVIADVYESL
jgi:hypothetical protein